MSDSSSPRRAEILQLGDLAGYLTERPGGGWTFTYLDGYSGPPISLTIPVQPEPHEFDSFPSPLEGLLPEAKKEVYHDLLKERSERLEIDPKECLPIPANPAATS